MADTWLDDMLTWLEESKAKQAKLNSQNTAMPDMVGPEMSTGSYAMQKQRNEQDLAKARPAKEDWWRFRFEGPSADDLGRQAAKHFIDPQTGKPIDFSETRIENGVEVPKYKDPSDPSWQEVYKNSPQVAPVNIPAQREWAQKYPGTGWQSRMWDRQNAPQLVPPSDMQNRPTAPMRGGVTGPGGYSTPEANAGGKVFEGYDQRVGAAPGAAGRGVREWGSEADRAADAAFEARSKAWDAEENTKNAREDAAKLQAGWKPDPSLMTRRDAEDWNRGQDQVGKNQQADWQKYIALMAKDNPNAANTNPTAAPPGARSGSAGAMTPTTQPEEYSFWEHLGNDVKAYQAKEAEMTKRAWAGDLSPEVQDWASNKAYNIAAGTAMGAGSTTPNQVSLRYGQRPTQQSYGYPGPTPISPELRDFRLNFSRSGGKQLNPYSMPNLGPRSGQLNPNLPQPTAAYGQNLIDFLARYYSAGM